MKTLLSLFIVAILAFTAKKQSIRMANSLQSGDTVVASFKALDFKGGDSALADEMLRRFKASEDGDSAKYIDAKVFQPKNAWFKVLLIRGEYSGATYTSFVLSYIILNDKITDVPFDGEVFRVDIKPNGRHLFYLAQDGHYPYSTFSVYEVQLSQDAVLAIKTMHYGNYRFDLIRQKKNSADSLPSISGHSPNANNKVPDSLGIGKGYYWFSDDPFLSKEAYSDDDFLETAVYFRYTNENTLEKILWVNHTGKKTERLLAMRSANPSVSVTSEFMNDSIFRELRVSAKTLGSLQNMITEEIDSVRTDYRYDIHLNFTEIQKKAYHYSIRHISGNNKPVLEKRISKSASFSVNSRNVHWEYDVDYPYYDGEKGKLANIGYTLIDESDGKKMLSAGQSSTNWSSEDSFIVDENFTDVNLDGHRDFKLLDVEASGSAGDYENVYIYNPGKKIFERSELFSGYDISVDEKSRTVTTYGKAGYWNFGITTIHLNKKSKVNFVENFSCRDENEKLILTYRKTKGKKMLVQKVREVAIGSVEGREDADAILHEMSSTKNRK